MLEVRKRERDQREVLQADAGGPQKAIGLTRVMVFEQTSPLRPQALVKQFCLYV